MSGPEPPKTKKKTSSSKKSKAVDPIPKGFHTVTPYLVVNNGSVAIEFYKKAFGAKETLRHETPDGKILNAQLKIGDSMVMLSDEFPGRGHEVSDFFGNIDGDSACLHEGCQQTLGAGGLGGRADRHAAE